MEGGSPGDDLWHELRNHIAVLAAVDQASKAQALQLLSVFFSRVTAKIAKSVNGSTQGLESLISLWTEDVLLLHDWLRRELGEQTEFLDLVCGEEAAGGDSPELQGVSERRVYGAGLRMSNADLTAGTLRCCIRILPLIECFDTGLSADCALTLKTLLQKLCSPVRLQGICARALASGRVHGKHPPYVRSLLYSENISVFERRDGREDMWCRRRSWQECSSFQEIKINSHAFDNGDCCQNAENSELLSRLDNQLDVICAMLEVYMDELLVNPDLFEVFLGGQDDEGSGGSAFGSQMEIVLEASFLHALLSFLRKKVEPVGASFSNAGDKLTRLPCVTLPASVLLLDIVSADGAPSLFLTHIANLVARSLHRWQPHSSPVSRSDQLSDKPLNITETNKQGMVGSHELFQLMHGADPARGSLSFGETDGSCKQRRFEDILSPRINLGLSLSVLETAVQLFTKVFNSAAVTSPQDCCNTDAHRRYSDLFAACLYKYRAVGRVLSTKAGVAVDHVFSSSVGILSDTKECDSRCCWGECSASSIEKTSQLCSSCGDHLWENQYQEANLCCRLTELYDGGKQREYDAVASQHLGEDFMHLDGQEPSKNSQEFACAVLHLISGALNRISAELCQIKHISVTRSPPDMEVAEEIHSISNCISAVFQLCLQCLKVDSVAGEEYNVGKWEESKSLQFKETIQCTLNVFSKIIQSETRRGVGDQLLKEYLHVQRSLGGLLHARVGELTGNYSSQTEATDKDCRDGCSPLSTTVDTETTGSVPLASVFPRASTLKIFMKLKHGRNHNTSKPGQSGSTHSNKKRTLERHSSFGSEEEAPSKQSEESEGVGNSFVQACIAMDKFCDGDSFNDINDFVVCKEGRDYVKYKKQRQKVLKRNRARSILRRQEERRELVAQLALISEMEQ